MSALPGQMQLFEPNALEASKHLGRYLASQDICLRRAERFELLGLDSAAALERRMAAAAEADAFVFACLIEFETLSGLTQ